VKELDKIRSWDLVELTLDGNPLCSKYDSESAYIRYVMFLLVHMLFTPGPFKNY